jgi:hypothetical protein
VEKLANSLIRVGGNKNLKTKQFKAVLKKGNFLIS